MSCSLLAWGWCERPLGEQSRERGSEQRPNLGTELFLSFPCFVLEQSVPIRAGSSATRRCRSPAQEQTAAPAQTPALYEVDLHS